MARVMYKGWLDKDKFILLQGWGRDGLTDARITHNVDISISTLGKWRREHVQIRQALKRGRDEINITAKSALLKRALSGNTTAIIFFLKNNWCDRHNDSQLFKEEHESVLANTRKANAGARVKGAKVIAAERLGIEDNEQLDQVLNKLTEEAGRVGTDKFISEEAD